MVIDGIYYRESKRHMWSLDVSNSTGCLFLAQRCSSHAEIKIPKPRFNKEQDFGIHSVRRASDLKQFHRLVDIDFIFRENQRRPLEGGDRQLFQRAHFARLDV